MTNHYFQSGIPIGRNSEQQLMESIIIECLSIYGFSVMYIPRQSVNPDMILNEDVLNKFKFAYPIDAYLSSVDGFQGEGSLLSKFGIEIRDTANFVIARRTWEEVVANEGNVQLKTRPSEGDLLYFPLTQSFFEIRRVVSKNPFFQVGKLYVYTLECELYQYSSEQFDTGVPEIDTFARDASLDEVMLNPGETAHTDPQSTNETFVDESDIISFDVNNPFGRPNH